jgi:chromosome segregation ATPase
MSQTFWESDTEEVAQPELDMQQEQESQAPEMQEPEFGQPEFHEPESQAPAAEPGSLALSVDDFSALEDRILRAVNLVKRERQARAEAEERAAKAEAQLSEQAPLVERLQKDLNDLRSERDMVRQRVEKLLTQLDALEL